MSTTRTKLVFPSSHVIFEGLRKVNKSVSEETKPVPILSYSKSKLINENDINKNSLFYERLAYDEIFSNLLIFNDLILSNFSIIFNICC